MDKIMMERNGRVEWTDQRFRVEWTDQRFEAALILAAGSGVACEAARLRLTRTYDDPEHADRAASVINEARLRPGCHAPLVVAVWGPEDGQKTVMTVEEAEAPGFVWEDD